MTATTSRQAEHSPLGWMAAELAAASAATGGAAHAVEVPFLAQISLRLDARQGAVATALARRLGAPLPSTPNRWTAGRVELLWLGPDEWLVVGSRDAQAPLLGALQAAFACGSADAAAGATAVDVTDQRTAIDLRGPAVRALLAGGCSLDLDRRAMAPGSCAQTLLAGAGVLLVARAGEPAFRLYVRRSFAEHVARWLIDAMAGLGDAG